MKRGDLSRLFFISLLVRLAMACLIPRPGYMDAAYYAAGAVRLAQTRGLTEPFIWNYLYEPASIPHPGFLYWMPLPSLLGALPAALFPGSFFALQVPFAFLSAALPVLTYALTWQTIRQRKLAWAAGLLTLFSGFFFPYWTLPETFTPFALVSALALWIAGRANSKPGEGARLPAHWLLTGVLVGLAHLARADGVLLLPVVAIAPFLPLGPSRRRNGDSALLEAAVPVAAVVLGYLLMMSPWFFRNLVGIGRSLSPAGTKTVWLTEYDDLFCYRCDLSFSSYLAWGWDNILHSKLSALWINFQRFLAENCLIFLFPFILLGLYHLVQRRVYLLASLYLVIIYLAHSLIFTFPGWRGGFFHASSASLPFLYAAGVEGLDRSLRWAARRRRGWRYQEAQSVFLTAAVAAAILFSAYVAAQRIPAWRRAGALYEEVDSWLLNQDSREARVMVGSPPTFWYATRRESTVIPNGDVQTLLLVADRYEIDYVLLEKDHPAPLDPLHSGQVGHRRLQKVNAWAEEESVLYRVAR